MLTLHEKRYFCAQRLPGYNSEEDIKDFIDNLYIKEDTGTGCDFIDDGAHGYLIVRPDHAGYKTADHIATASYSYSLPDGSILLEEDCEAPDFIDRMKKEAAC